MAGGWEGEGGDGSIWGRQRFIYKMSLNTLPEVTVCTEYGIPYLTQNCSSSAIRIRFKASVFLLACGKDKMKQLSKVSKVR